MTTFIKLTDKQKNDIANRLGEKLLKNMENNINKELDKFNEKDSMCAHDYINLVLNAVCKFNVNFLNNLRVHHKKDFNIDIDLASVLMNLHEGMVIDLSNIIKKQNMN